MLLVLKKDNYTRFGPTNIVRSFEFSYNKKLLMKTLDRLNVLVFFLYVDKNLFLNQ